MFQYCVRLLRLCVNCNVNLRLLEYNSFRHDSNRYVNNFSQCDKKDRYTELASILSNYLDLDVDTSKSIVQCNKNLANHKLMNIQKSLETCSNFNIDKVVLKNNLWLLEMNPDILQKKLDVLSKMNFEDINHGVPFLSKSENILKRIQKEISIEATLSSHNNRLYYLSEKLTVDPVILANIVAKRHFIYNIPFERLRKTLDIIIDYKIRPDNIIKDLWVLRYKPEAVQERLEKFSKSGKKFLMPWMIKCSKDILERSINITMTTKKVLGKNNSSLSYLASRLNCSPDVIEEMCKRTRLSTIRVSKLQNILDFLFSVGFSERDIISTPRVFPHSLRTLKKKFSILKSLNNENINLNSLCLSNRDFKKKYFKKITPKD